MGKAHVQFLHPEKDGHGVGMRVQLHYQTDKIPGFIRFLIAQQSDGGFDFERALCCDLECDALAKVLQVLRGEWDASGDYFFESLKEHIDSSLIARRLDGKDGVSFTAFPKARQARTSNALTIALTSSECLGLRLAMEHAMFFIAFIKGVTP